MYYKNTGEEAYQKVEQIYCIGAVKKYQLACENNLYVEENIYEQQIIGKVVSIVDNNLWNVISMKIWDVSINRLNLAALFTNN